MSTLNNYMHQSFIFRGRTKLKPFYDLVVSITAEEFGYVELVSNIMNVLNKNSSFSGESNMANMYRYSVNSTSKRELPYILFLFTIYN